ncbi:MAG: hypothetical protein JST54_08000 [Deltaproteobacteria bacterium]|nr:hypothetical protein [Deltaproteobacteria bacterium]
MSSKIDHGAAEAARHGLVRSPEWPRVERAHLLRQPRCVCCGPGMNLHAALQVHHIFPFHCCILLGRPDLELDDRNLITLCESESSRPGENHHLLVGHLDSFQSANLAALADATTTFHALLAKQIRVSVGWLAEVAKRMKPFEQLSVEDRQALRQLMTERLPRK